ncbi:MAG: nitrilase-related carbon-nitrogen hydrolase, partial [Gammaproteobacteria bacterium]
MATPTDFCTLGFFRAAAVAPALALADPETNAQRIADAARTLAADAVSLAVFPELCLTGYTCEDLFLTASLHAACRRALTALARDTAALPLTLVVGMPWQTSDGRMVNAAVVLAGGIVRGVVPKLHLPNYEEFYERRWFTSGFGIDETVTLGRLGTFRLRADQLFQIGQTRFGIELCEDLWAPEPPGIGHCLAGADLVVNPSASTELVAKASYRRDLVRMTSARGLCGYLYAGSGALESTKDVVFGGHLLAAENGIELGESPRFGFTGATLTV